MILILTLIAITLALGVATITARKNSTKLEEPIERPVEGPVQGEVKTPEEVTVKAVKVEDTATPTSKPKKKYYHNPKPKVKSNK